jgi:DNA-directed RNA polymerase specialized sigma24 family protein
LDLPFSTEDLVRLYRFALLLTGDEGASQRVLYDACADCAPRLGSFRNEESQLACILDNVRQKARVLPAGETRGGIASAFGSLPEEERAALAGLYSGLLSARELAEAMKMSLDQLGRVLKSARERLALSSHELGPAGDCGATPGQAGEPNLEPTA